jgi:hypothetical protein
MAKRTTYYRLFAFDSVVHLESEQHANPPVAPLVPFHPISALLPRFFGLLMLMHTLALVLCSSRRSTLPALSFIDTQRSKLVQLFDSIILVPTFTPTPTASFTFDPIVRVRALFFFGLLALMHVFALALFFSPPHPVLLVLSFIPSLDPILLSSTFTPTPTTLFPFELVVRVLALFFFEPLSFNFELESLSPQVLLVRSCWLLPEKTLFLFPLPSRPSKSARVWLWLRIIRCAGTPRQTHAP